MKVSEYAYTVTCIKLGATFYITHWNDHINSLAAGRPGCHFKTAIFNLVLLIGIFTSSNDNALGWMPWDLTDDKSTLIQVMAWCRQTTSHYLSQCWPSPMSPYSVTRPQWIKWHSLNDIQFVTVLLKLMARSQMVPGHLQSLCYPLFK